MELEPLTGARGSRQGPGEDSKPRHGRHAARMDFAGGPRAHPDWKADLGKRGASSRLYMIAAQNPASCKSSGTKPWHSATYSRASQAFVSLSEYSADWLQEPPHLQSKLVLEVYISTSMVRPRPQNEYLAGTAEANEPWSDALLRRTTSLSFEQFVSTMHYPNPPRRSAH